MAVTKHRVDRKALVSVPRAFLGMSSQLKPAVVAPRLSKMPAEMASEMPTRRKRAKSSLSRFRERGVKCGVCTRVQSGMPSPQIPEWPTILDGNPCLRVLLPNWRDNRVFRIDDSGGDVANRGDSNVKKGCDCVGSRTTMVPSGGG